MWNEAVVAYFKVLRQNFLEELKKTTNNFRLNGIPAENWIPYRPNMKHCADQLILSFGLQVTDGRVPYK